MLDAFFAVGPVFVAVQMVVLGALQLPACFFGKEIHRKAHCWLRTPCGELPSVFVTKIELANIMRRNLLTYGKDRITQIILGKRKPVDNTTEIHEDLRKAA